MIMEDIEGSQEALSDYIPSTTRAWYYRARAVIRRQMIAGERTWSCEACGSGSYLHIHHVDRDITNTDPRNLRLLCYRCHKKEHPERLNFIDLDQLPTPEEIIAE